MNEGHLSFKLHVEDSFWVPFEGCQIKCKAREGQSGCGNLICASKSKPRRKEEANEWSTLKGCPLSAANNNNPHR